MEERLDVKQVREIDFQDLVELVSVGRQWLIRENSEKVAEI